MAVVEFIARDADMKRAQKLNAEAGAERGSSMRVLLAYVRLAALVISYVVLSDMLSRWFPVTASRASAAYGIWLAAYWALPKPRMTCTKWVALSALCAACVFLMATNILAAVGVLLLALVFARVKL